MNRTVLYIEDNALNIRLVERLLARRPGIELQVATSARDGLMAARGQPPALILLDNGLPDATGGQTLRQLRAGPATAAIPVVIISGESAQQAIDELLAAGASDYLVKPFDIHQFMAVIDRYLP